MLSNEKNILSSIKQDVKSVDPTAEIILFGSRARGDHRNDSDWDILILTDEAIDKRYKSDVREILYHLQLELEISISSLFRNKKKWQEPTAMPVDNEIKREGVRV